MPQLCNKTKLKYFYGINIKFNENTIVIMWSLYDEPIGDVVKMISSA